HLILEYLLAVLARKVAHLRHLVSRGNGPTAPLVAGRDDCQTRGPGLLRPLEARLRPAVRWARAMPGHQPGRAIAWCGPAFPQSACARDRLPAGEIAHARWSPVPSTTRSMDPPPASEWVAPAAATSLM